MRIIITILIVAAIATCFGATLYFLPVFSAHNGLQNRQLQGLVVGSSAPVNSGYRQVNVTVNGVNLIADVASTDIQQTKGLAVKDHLNENEAMIFVFTTPGNHAFWMKDMKFPIDIIWMDANKTVVHIEHSLNPCTPISCPIYQPNVDSLYVLETVAGFANKYHIVEGTKMQFNVSF